jgi:hypothetical protein
MRVPTSTTIIKSMERKKESRNICNKTGTLSYELENSETTPSHSSIKTRSRFPFWSVRLRRDATRRADTWNQRKTSNGPFTPLDLLSVTQGNGIVFGENPQKTRELLPKNTNTSVIYPESSNQVRWFEASRASHFSVSLMTRKSNTRNRIHLVSREPPKTEKHESCPFSISGAIRKGNEFPDQEWWVPSEGWFIRVNGERVTIHFVVYGRESDSRRFTKSYNANSNVSNEWIKWVRWGEWTMTPWWLE